MPRCPKPVRGSFNMRTKMNNGHTQIDNEMLDKLAKFHMCGNEWQIVCVILRKTNGWQKKSDTISLTQFEKATGLSRPAVCIAIKKLVAKNVLVAKQLLHRKEYEINTDVLSWTSSKIATSSIKRTTLVAKQLPVLVAKQQHTKETIKETITKETTTIVVGETEKVDHRNIELQELIDFAKQNNFPFQGTYVANRRSAWNLLRKYGLDKSKQAVFAAIDSRGRPYAPIISDFTKLYQKYGDLEAYYIKNSGLRKDPNAKPIIG